MERLTFLSKRISNKKDKVAQKHFSFKNSLSFLSKNLAILIGMITLFIVSGGSIVGIVIFSGSYLIFAICTSILASYKPEKKNKYIDIKRFTKKEILGLVIAFVVTSLLSLVVFCK